MLVNKPASCTERSVLASSVQVENPAVRLLDSGRMGNHRGREHRRSGETGRSLIGDALPLRKPDISLPFGREKGRIAMIVSEQNFVINRAEVRQDSGWDMGELYVQSHVRC